MPSALMNQMHVAVLALCTDAPLSTRLNHAYEVLAAVDPAWVPEQVQARFDELVADMTYGADTVPEALAQMSAADRVVLAGRLVSFYGDVARQLGPEA